MLVFAQITYTNRKARQRLQRQLLQIQEEHEERPQPIRKAIETVEATFFASDEYHTLQHRLSSGQRLKEDSASHHPASLLYWCVTSAPSAAYAVGCSKRYSAEKVVLGNGMNSSFPSGFSYCKLLASPLL